MKARTVLLLAAALELTAAPAIAADDLARVKACDKTDPNIYFGQSRAALVRCFKDPPNRTERRSTGGTEEVYFYAAATFFIVNGTVHAVEVNR